MRERSPEKSRKKEFKRISKGVKRENDKWNAKETQKTMNR